jgi:hypothetical protein
VFMVMATIRDQAGHESDTMSTLTVSGKVRSAHGAPQGLNLVSCFSAGSNSFRFTHLGFDLAGPRSSPGFKKPRG